MIAVFKRVGTVSAAIRTGQVNIRIKALQTKKRGAPKQVLRIREESERMREVSREGGGVDRPVVAEQQSCVAASEHSPREVAQGRRRIALLAHARHVAQHLGAVALLPQAGAARMGEYAVGMRGARHGQGTAKARVPRHARGWKAQALWR